MHLNKGKDAADSDDYHLSILNLMKHPTLFENRSHEQIGRDLRKMYVNPLISSMPNIVINSSFEKAPLVYFIEKCPRNFYGPHVAYLMATYFSTPHPVSIGNNEYQSAGSRVLCIIRNPMQRLNSWYNMHHGDGDIVSDLSKALRAEIVLKIHGLIVNNTYDQGTGGKNDAVMLLEYLQWLYPYVHERRVTGKYLEVTHMVMWCLYYPQLLIWLGIYSEMDLLGTHFKLMSFPYLTSPSTRYQALHGIYTWTKSGIWDNNRLDAVKEQTLKDREPRNEAEFVKTNSFSREYPSELVEPLKNFFGAIAPHNDALLRRFGNHVIFIGPPFVW